MAIIVLSMMTLSCIQSCQLRTGKVVDDGWIWRDETGCTFLHAFFLLFFFSHASWVCCTVACNHVTFLVISGVKITVLFFSLKILVHWLFCDWKFYFIMHGWSSDNWQTQVDSWNSICLINENSSIKILWLILVLMYHKPTSGKGQVTTLNFSLVFHRLRI